MNRFKPDLFFSTDCNSDELAVRELLHDRISSYGKAKKELSTFTPGVSFHRECTVCPTASPGESLFLVSCESRVI